eukprot:COSAG04_NODE_25557_length_306_cov_0.637681_1_plen_49_part_01
MLVAERARERGTELELSGWWRSSPRELGSSDQPWLSTATVSAFSSRWCC